MIEIDIGLIFRKGKVKVAYQHGRDNLHMHLKFSVEAIECMLETDLELGQSYEAINAMT